MGLGQAVSRVQGWSWEGICLEVRVRDGEASWGK